MTSSEAEKLSRLSSLCPKEMCFESFEDFMERGGPASERRTHDTRDIRQFDRSLWTSTRLIPDIRTRVMKPVCVGEEKDGFFKPGDFAIHFVLLDVQSEVRQVIDGTLAMGSCNHVGS